MEHREEEIVVETERYRIAGLLRLPRDGYRSRMTDFLNSIERDFIALSDARITPLDGIGEEVREPFVTVSLRHIVLATLARPGTGEGVDPD